MREPVPYSIRESARAKRVILKLAPGRKLEVVVPKGFNCRRIPEVIKKHETWIQNTLRKYLAHGYNGNPAVELPETIDFQSVAMHYRVEVVSRPSRSCAPCQVRGSLLTVITNHGSNEKCLELLRSWVFHQGKLHLLPWLERTSLKTGLRFGKAQVRGQKSRWGSCSSKGAISLNYKLLFLPRPLVEYILVHELCHTLHLNHSKQFWSLVAGLKPDFRSLDAAMRDAWKYIPPWLG